MNNSQIRLLSKMRKLINEGHRKFQQRSDRDYVEELLDIGITEEEAWFYVLTLKPQFYFPDPKPNYSKDGESLTFKRDINEVRTYIKLKIEKNEKGEEETVCLSFHRDEKR